MTDQVGGWAGRVVSKLNSQILGNETPGVKKQSILQLFNQITDIVCGQLEELVQQQEEDEGTGYITAKDFMNDFATEEFLTKNIRVRPQSGATGKDADDRQSEHVSRNNLAAVLGEPTDDEEKFNKMVNLEMEDQRRKIKVQRDEVEKKKQLELERQAKAAARKK